MSAGQTAGEHGESTGGPSSRAVFHGSAAITVNEPLARDTYRLRLHAPALAAAIRPGQFLMLRLPGRSDPLLGRPFALYDTATDERGQAVAVDVVYLVVGKATRALAQLRPGDALEVWGPLGNGFAELNSAGHIACVAGGIGQTPFLAYAHFLLGGKGYGGQPARVRVAKVSLYYGVRTAALAAGVDDFRGAGADLHLATDDGSLGHHGFVTGLLEQHLASGQPTPPELLIGCGPEPMLRALWHLAQRWNLPCHLSLETPMACGVGICFSCVTPVKTADGWDYRRTCVDGPVFDASVLAWENH